MKKKASHPQYGYLKEKGEATKRILTLIKKETVLLGLDTYRLLDYMIGILGPYPFPSHLMKPIIDGLETLERRGYLDDGKSNEFAKKIRDRVIRNIKAFQKKNKPKDVGLPSRKHPVYRQAFPSTTIAEMDYPLNFLLYFMAHQIKAVFKTSDGQRMTKWQLIEDFLGEHNICDSELTDTDSAKSLEMRHSRSKKHIEVTYLHIYNGYPHGSARFSRLPSWNDLMRN